MSRLRIIVVVILVTGLTSLCFANVPIKLQITGPEGFCDMYYPSGGYTAELTGATSTGEYEWNISVSTPYASFVGTPQGKNATIEFTSAPSASEGELTVIVLCKTYYMDGNQRKSESAHLNVTWRCPRLTYGINGNTEVLDGIEETYTAWVSIEGNPNPSVIYEWRKGESQGSGIEANPFITTFNSEDGQNVTLYCDIKAGDIPLKAQTEIHVNAYAMSVERWDYSGNLDNGPPGKRKVIHTNSTTSDSETVYIHYNIDDDDESEGSDVESYDCDQKEFIKNERDDDLCELKIEIFVQGPFSVDDLDKPITITISKGLRLWRSQYRTGNDFMQGSSDETKDKDITKTWPVSSINGKIRYVEGVEYNSPETLTITFGKITKTLSYKTCSVGKKTDQPNLELRRSYKSDFPNFIDCEWCVFRPENPTYNCIAFSVDPYLDTFKNVSYVNRAQIINNMKIDSNYPYPFWVDDIGFNKIDCPVNSSDTMDKFRLVGFSYCNLSLLNELRRLSRTDDFNMVYSSKVYQFSGILAISGYTEYFKREIINLFSGLYAFKDLKYCLTMRDFNPYTPAWTLNGDIQAFFSSPVWANSNGKNLKACDNNDDGSRVVVFYDNFHAARRASTLKGKEKIEENEIPPGWVVFASKCGDCEAIFHMEDQMEGGKYGNIYQAYKYQGE